MTAGFVETYFSFAEVGGGSVGAVLAPKRAVLKIFA